MKDTTEGIVVTSGQGQSSALTQLSCPHGVIVDQLGTVYVADSFNQRIVCWLKGATRGRIVVNGTLHGNINPLGDPVGLSFNRSDNIYVSDFNNHRVQKFNIDLSLCVHSRRK
jgi:DNA-binding beta-propeller fold protein YncE